MLFNLRVVDRSKSNRLDFSTFVVDDSNDDRHKPSDLMSRNKVWIRTTYAACSVSTFSICDMSLSSSVISAALAIPIACCALRTPTIAPVTAGFRNVHAMAISPGVALQRLPMERSVSTSRRLGESNGSWKFQLFFRQSSSG